MARKTNPYDNVLNKLNKKLRQAYTSFGAGSEIYQTLSRNAIRILGRYGLTSMTKTGLTIRRSRPKLNGTSQTDFDRELKALEAVYDKEDLRAWRSRYIQAVQNSRITSGQSVKQARKRVTISEIKDIAARQTDLDDRIKNALDLLYTIRKKVKARYNEDNTYRAYATRIDRMAMKIMKQSKKSVTEIENVIDVVNSITPQEPTLSPHTVTTQTGLDMLATATDRSIDIITQNPKRASALRTKYNIK